jgi:hypothetical protein
MKKHSADHEIVLSSPFKLHDCVSRLRSLARREQWTFTRLSLGDNAYYFTMSGKRHSAVVGYLYRQETSTLVTIQPERNWLLLIFSFLLLLALVPFEFGAFTGLYHYLFQTPAYLSLYSLGTAAVNSVLLALLLTTSVNLLLLCRRVYQKPLEIARTLEASLSDALTDLPAADAWIEEDGELIFFEGMNEGLPESSSQRS